MKTRLLIALAVMAAMFHYSESLAVMSVDMGSEYLKIAIVKPGVPMEIVLNKESRRKTSSIVSLRNDERLFSDPAMNTGVKFPAKAYWYLTELLGKPADHPVVQQFHQKFPYYTIEAEPDTNMVVFRHDEETTFSVEELLAMILQHAKENAEAFAEQPISEAVLTVPPYFNQAERRALIRAGELAGLKVLQLMNDNTAVALNYGVFRRKEFNSTKMHFLFFDMGATSTTASIVEYTEVKDKNKVTGIVDKFPQVTVLGVGYDRSLGGSDLQIRLRDHLAKVFNEQKKTSLNVFENPRSMAKLYKEAGRVKHVLSANANHHAQVEGLLDEQDFKAKVTRDEFETMNADLFERITKVVEEAIKSSQVTKEELIDVILMGGSTRIPKVQETLSKAVNRYELGKSINTDEAAALGAVYQAAHLSKGFKVKKFNIKEANMFPIAVEFERFKQPDDSSSETKVTKRVLFNRNNPYPQNKVMTFSKHTQDFGFKVIYTDLGFLSPQQLGEVGEQHLQTVTLTGVQDALAKMPEGSEWKGVKAHFRMNDSGILDITNAEFVYENNQTDTAEQDEQSTLSKLSGSISDSISSFFTSSAKLEPLVAESEKTEGEKEKEAEGEEKKEGEEQKQEETKQEEQTTEKEEKKTEEGADTEGKEDNKNDTKTDSKAEKEKVKETKPKVVTTKEVLGVSVETRDLGDPSKDKLKAYKSTLKKLTEKDAAILELAKAQNELESFLVDSNDKLYQDDYMKCSTEEERESISKQFSEGSDWLYDQEPGTGAKAYKDKLSELKKVIAELWDRVRELQERPQALQALNSMVNHSEFFLQSMKNYTGEESGEKPFTVVEFTTLEKLIKTTKEWNDTMFEEQSKAPLTEKPKITIMDVAHKIQDLEREVKYLVNKAKTFKPKPPKKEEDKNTTKTDNTTKPTADVPTSEDKPSDGGNETKADGGFDTSQFEKDLEEDHQAQEKKDKKKEEKEGEKEGEAEPLMLDGSEPDQSTDTSTGDKDETVTHDPGEM